MVIDTWTDFFWLCLTLYGACDLGHKFQRWVNS